MIRLYLVYDPQYIVTLLARFLYLSMPSLLFGMPIFSQSAYTVAPVPLPAGWSFAVPTAINNMGQITGHGRATSDISFKAFIGSVNGSVAIQSPPQAGSVFSYSINDAGQITGQFDNSNSSSQPYIGNLNGIVPISLGGLPSGVGVGINSSGLVVGWLGPSGTAGTDGIFTSTGGSVSQNVFDQWSYLSATGVNDLGQFTGGGDFGAVTRGPVRMALIGTPSAISIIPPPAGWALSYGQSINNSGQVAGYAADSSVTTFRAFVGTAQGSIALPLPTGWSNSIAASINSAGQVVGNSDPSSVGGWIWDADNGSRDLDSLIPADWSIISVAGINDSGQIVGVASNAKAGFINGAVILTPVCNPCIKIVNPFADNAILKQAPATLVTSAVPFAPSATSLAADGQSAAVLVYQSKSPQSVTFQLSANGAGIASGTSLGSLSEFDPDYLKNPNPGGALETINVDSPTDGPDAAGNYSFFALVWSPSSMPIPGQPLTTLTITATQPGTQDTHASLDLKPPPLLLVHGIWSSASGAKFTPGSGGFFDWIARKYPHPLVFTVDYSGQNAKSFTDPTTQQTFLDSAGDALTSASAAGMVARTVDVVAHSMGGLVTRYFMSNTHSGNPALLANPVHKLITIGTPHLGTDLATALFNYQDRPITSLASPLVALWCAQTFSFCTLGDFFRFIGQPVDTGVQSLQTGSQQIHTLSSTNVFSTIVGSAPTSPISASEALLDVIIGAFLPGQTVSSILHSQPNDILVPISSQNPPGAEDSATVTGIVHTSLCGPCSTGETADGPPQMVPATASSDVWDQAYWWLTGGPNYVPVQNSKSRTAPKAFETTPTAPPTILDLSGYTQTSSSNVNILPSSGSLLMINSSVSITASSPSKIISEVILLQNVADSVDDPLLYSTQTPFSISYTPRRLGTANFTVVVVFSDQTYTTTALQYTLEPTGTPYSLNLANVPVATMTSGSSQQVRVYANYTSGSIDVTQVATFGSGSGSSNVFSVNAGGSLTANNNGADLLDVSYGGLTASASILVGACTYLLSPSNQIVASAGGTVSIQVTTQSGCSWAASGGAIWLPIDHVTGSGSSSFTLSVSPNISGSTQAARITIAGIQTTVTQPAIPCTYTLSQSQINAPAAGANGTVTVTTSCPVVISSNQSWVTAAPVGSAVAYTLSPNNGTSQRSAIVTVGSASLSINQSGNSRSSAVFQLSLTHAGEFDAGQRGARYAITLSNIGTVATSGLVSVVDTLPSGFVAAAISGAGWICALSSISCTRSDSLAPFATYPSITITVDVNSNSISPVTNVVSVSGGGSPAENASEITVIAAAIPLSSSGAGSGTSHTFSFAFSNVNGWANIQHVDILINSALDGRQACYLAFVPSGTAGGSLFLVDDAGDSGGPYLGMVLPGTGTAQNNQCTINGTGASVVGSGSNLTLTIPITFNAGFAGNKIMYLSAQDVTGVSSAWQPLSTWSVPGQATVGPWVTEMSPAQGSTDSQIYTFTFADANGWQDIKVIDILLNSSIDGREGCYLAIVPSTAAAASVFLIDDAGDAGGPYSGMVLPGTGTIQNSQCSITGTGSLIVASGNTLTVTLAAAFNQSFAGNKVFYLAARNAGGQNSGWQAAGTVNIQ